MNYVPSSMRLRAMTHDELVAGFQNAAANNNEFDNRERVLAYRVELLRRLNGLP